MSSLGHLFRRAIFGADSRLRDYELACLNAMRSALTPAAQSVLTAQLGVFDLVQRLSDDKLTTFHDLRDRTYKVWPEGQFFVARRKEELVAASVWFRFKSTSKTTRVVKADIVLYDGRLASIQFDKTPTRATRGESAEGEVDILRATVWIDPMREIFDPEPLDVGALRGWIGELAAQGQVVSARLPLPQEQRSMLLNQLESGLPPDYLEVIAQADGCDLGACRILGLTELWRIVQPTETFIVIAEIAGQSDIAIPQGGGGQLYVLDHEEQDVPRPSGYNLRDVLKRECPSLSTPQRDRPKR